MNYRIEHTTKYAYSEAVPVCHNILHLTSRNTNYQTCDDAKLIILPEPLDLRCHDDYFGNRVNYFSIEQPHRGLTVTAKSQVRVFGRTRPPAGTLPAWETVVDQLRCHRDKTLVEAYPFTFASSNVTPFAELREYAAVSFPTGRPILESALDLTRRIHEDFKYDPRATTTHTPIAEVFRQRHGVCQDFAHVQIGCIRSLGLAARYVSGYLRTIPPPGKPRLVGADASHAWVSVFCGDTGWIDVDPTNNLLVSTDHITLAWGRDYNDVCPIQGVIVGGGDHRMTVAVDVVPEDAQ